MSGLMRPVTAAEVSATAAIRFREQYRDWSYFDRFANGTSKAEVEEVFNSQPHTPANVAAVLNAGWAYPECSCCGSHVNAAVRIREEWGDQDTDFCEKCLRRALAMLEGLDTSEAPK